MFQIVVINLIFFLDELFALFLVNSGEFNDLADKCSGRFGSDRNFGNMEERLSVFLLQMLRVSNANPGRNHQIELSLGNTQPIHDTIIFWSEQHIDFKARTTEDASNFLVVTAPILVVVGSFKPKVHQAFLAFALVIANELVDNRVHDFFMTEKVVPLESGGINGDDRVTQIAIIAHQSRNVVANQAAHATRKNHIEVTVKNLERRFNQLIKGLDAAKNDVVFG